MSIQELLSGNGSGGGGGDCVKVLPGTISLPDELDHFINQTFFRDGLHTADHNQTSGKGYLGIHSRNIKFMADASTILATPLLETARQAVLAHNSGDQYQQVPSPILHLPTHVGNDPMWYVGKPTNKTDRVLLVVLYGSDLELTYIPHDDARHKDWNAALNEIQVKYTKNHAVSGANAIDLPIPERDHFEGCKFKVTIPLIPGQVVSMHMSVPFSLRSADGPYFVQMVSFEPRGPRAAIWEKVLKNHGVYKMGSFSDERLGQTRVSPSKSEDDPVPLYKGSHEAAWLTTPTQAPKGPAKKDQEEAEDANIARYNALLVRIAALPDGITLKKNADASRSAARLKDYNEDKKKNRQKFVEGLKTLENEIIRCEGQVGQQGPLVTKLRDIGVQLNTFEPTGKALASHNSIMKFYKSCVDERVNVVDKKDQIIKMHEKVLALKGKFAEPGLPADLDEYENEQEPHMCDTMEELEQILRDTTNARVKINKLADPKFDEVKKRFEAEYDGLKREVNNGSLESAYNAAAVIAFRDLLLSFEPKKKAAKQKSPVPKKEDDDEGEEDEGEDEDDAPPECGCRHQDPLKCDTCCKCNYMDIAADLKGKEEEFFAIDTPDVAEYKRTKKEAADVCANLSSKTRQRLIDLTDKMAALLTRHVSLSDSDVHSDDRPNKSDSSEEPWSDEEEESSSDEEEEDEEDERRKKKKRERSDSVDNSSPDPRVSRKHALAARYLDARIKVPIFKKLDEAERLYQRGDDKSLTALDVLLTELEATQTVWYVQEVEGSDRQDLPGYFATKMEAREYASAKAGQLGGYNTGELVYEVREKKI